MCAFGFLAFQIISRVIYGFWVGFMSVRVKQGLLWVFGVYPGFL